MSTDKSFFKTDVRIVAQITPTFIVSQNISAGLPRLINFDLALLPAKVDAKVNISAYFYDGTVAVHTRRFIRVPPPPPEEGIVTCKRQCACYSPPCGFNLTIPDTNEGQVDHEVSGLIVDGLPFIATGELC